MYLLPQNMMFHKYRLNTTIYITNPREHSALTVFIDIVNYETVLHALKQC